MINIQKKNDEWDPRDIDHSKEVFNARLIKCTTNLGVQHAIKIIKRSGIDYEHLKIAEVGCGTGTFSLLFALLGASVTLIDNNEKVIKNTKKIYELYECKADFLKVNCLEPAEGGLKEQFDIVVSGGLAEHFQGADRKKCIDFHKQLVKPDGFIYVGTPNALSLPYWIVRIYRYLAHTWRISIEKPFTYMEFNKIAKGLDFQNTYVVGNNSIFNDIKDYSRGLLSAIAESLPKSIYKSLRRGKRKIKRNIKGLNPQEKSFDIKDFCLKKIKEIQAQPVYKRPIADKLSAGITLFASKQQEVL